MQLIANQLEAVVNTSAPLMIAMSGDEVNARLAPGEWSKKEIIGHLLDSATNNHQRFVRAQQIERLEISGYAQNEWVSQQHYQEEDWHRLVVLWRHYNLHLAHVIRYLPESVLRRELVIGTNRPLTLAWVVSDYLAHLMHHLRDVLPKFEPVTTIHKYGDFYQQGIFDLIVPIQREEFGIPITPDEQPDLKDVKNYYQEGRGNFWLAVQNWQVIGTIALKDIGEGQGALRKMFVRHNFRGDGTAQFLLDTLLEWALVSGIHDIYLGTTDKFLAAHRFYEKHGFTAVDKSALPERFPVMEVDSRFYRRQV